MKAIVLVNLHTGIPLVTSCVTRLDQLRASKFFLMDYNLRYEVTDPRSFTSLK